MGNLKTTLEQLYKANIEDDDKREGLVIGDTHA